MINWLFICNAIVKYAEYNAREIISNPKPITLDNVLDFYTTHYKTTDAVFLSNYLKAYIVERKAYFAKDKAKKDYISAGELVADKNYRFEYEGVNGLI